MFPLPQTICTFCATEYLKSPPTTFQRSRNEFKYCKVLEVSLVKELTLKNIMLSTRRDKWRENKFDVWQDTDKQDRKGRKNNEVRKLKWKRDRKDGGAARSFTKLSEKS